MSDHSQAWQALIEDYVQETGTLRGKVKPGEYKSGRAILNSAPDERTWFLLEAWRLNMQAWKGGTHPHASSAALLCLAMELLRKPLFCTPEQMQRIIWQANAEEVSTGLLNNVENHLAHWGMTPDVYKMLDIKRVELGRMASNKEDRSRLERIDALLGKTQNTN